MPQCGLFSSVRYLCAAQAFCRELFSPCTCQSNNKATAFDSDQTSMCSCVICKETGCSDIFCCDVLWGYMRGDCGVLLFSQPVVRHEKGAGRAHSQSDCRTIACSWLPSLCILSWVCSVCVHVFSACYITGTCSPLAFFWFTVSFDWLGCFPPSVVGKHCFRMTDHFGNCL